MSYQIAFAWNAECERQLVAKGFKKTEVYLKYTDAPPAEAVDAKTIERIHLKHAETTGEQIRRGDSEFFHMESPPFMFVTTSWWGAGED
ncbi:MAG: hypothetical protein WBQ34_09940 [Candidatus Acidiferrales bacterium]